MPLAAGANPSIGHFGPKEETPFSTTILATEGESVIITEETLAPFAAAEATADLLLPGRLTEIS
ncbi:MAG: hypothetical protein RLZZ568_1868, partial [Cyanobacteriota bacterium]